MKDTFSTYHPLLNMLYFVGVIGVTVFVVHPVILAISLFGGIAYSVLLKGWKKTVKFGTDQYPHGSGKGTAYFRQQPQRQK